ncbi:hypothetical protein [Salinimonas lutimaris]|uniref:hypothetical protein n=1 Tax=Salinimonas lutimaris TaxID=914153 RepID=UPI001586986A|nr:hypothetical protein [Salinimonas lutimaris]
MKKIVKSVLVTSALLTAACSDEPPEAIKQAAPEQAVTVVNGQWITEHDGSLMHDPQPSGLSHWQGKLVTISDNSADPAQQRRLHILDPQTASLAPRTSKFRLGSQVRRSCFSAYLADQPDLEALVADPQDPQVFYSVTEDATRTGALSSRCQSRYENTGSTDYPTLLVRLERLDSGDMVMTRVRPLQFALDLQVGDFPNDGIEGMALGADNTLYLALEKDMAGKARIFSVQMDDGFWESTDFANVEEPDIQLPDLGEGNHPVNALEYYSPASQDEAYLLAVARNDDELWVLDISGNKAAKRIKMDFTAPTHSDECQSSEVMDNASIEGITVINDTVWLINDPWKENYLKNVQCPATQSRYKGMAPLLFSTPLKPDWFGIQASGKDA